MCQENYHIFLTDSTRYRLKRRGQFSPRPLIKPIGPRSRTHWPAGCASRTGNDRANAFGVFLGDNEWRCFDVHPSNADFSGAASNPRGILHGPGGLPRDNVSRSRTGGAHPRHSEQTGRICLEAESPREDHGHGPANTARPRPEPIPPSNLGDSCQLRESDDHTSSPAVHAVVMEARQCTSHPRCSRPISNAPPSAF